MLIDVGWPWLKGHDRRNHDTWYFYRTAINTAGFIKFCFPSYVFLLGANLINKELIGSVSFSNLFQILSHYFSFFKTTVQVESYIIIPESKNDPIEFQFQLTLNWTFTWEVESNHMKYYGRCVRWESVQHLRYVAILGKLNNEWNFNI